MLFNRQPHALLGWAWQAWSLETITILMVLYMLCCIANHACLKNPTLKTLHVDQLTTREKRAFLSKWEKKKMSNSEGNPHHYVSAFKYTISQA